jgi:hypothetical protein
MGQEKNFFQNLLVNPPGYGTNEFFWLPAYPPGSFSTWG